MRFYCTKWVLTRGIVEFDGEVKVGLTGDQYVSESSRGGGIFARLGVDAFASLEEARRDALLKAEADVGRARRATERAERRLTAFQSGEIVLEHTTGTRGHTDQR